MNALGLISSYVFIGLIMFSALYLSKKGILSASAARKSIHIGVSNWWLLAFTLIRGPVWLLIGPVSFIIINFLIAKYKLFPGMTSDGGKNYGTIYFPCSLTLCVLAVSYLGVSPIAAGIGVLCMGWGDGMASVFGERIKSISFKVLGNRKSLSGCMAMFFFSFVVALIGYYIAGFGFPFVAAFITAFTATVIEALTPFVFDNLSVPLIITMLAHGFLKGY